MSTYTLDQTQLVRRPLGEVFAFFSDPQNLELLTPPILGFKILTPTPIEMRVGALIDYRISLRGLPLRWRTRIDAYDPMRSFVDVQLRGPYRSWRHTHVFEERPEGTEVRDHVEYSLPFGPIGALVHRLFVRRDLETIFTYRREAMHRLLESPGGEATP
jgi:ligand-binding SRPBCC domain-containing protein